METNAWKKNITKASLSRIPVLRLFTLLIVSLLFSSDVFSNIYDKVSIGHLNDASTKDSTVPGYYQPVNFDLIKGWDFEGLRGQSFDTKVYLDGMDLHHQHIPNLYPTVQNTKDNSEIQGSLNGLAVPLRAIRYQSSNRETRRRYSRAELRAYIDENLAPASRMGKKVSGRYYYSRIGEEYVYQIRMKPTKRWDKDIGTPSGRGQDLYCSVIDLKQDHTGTPKRSRDASFRIRMHGDYANIVVNGDNADGANYKENDSHFTLREKVYLPEFYDGDWHTFTVRVKWHPSRGHTYVYFDDRLIWSRTNFTNCYRDDQHSDLGPYFKFGVYDAGFVANMNSGSNEKEALIDYAALGFYNPNGKGYEKYSQNLIAGKNTVPTVKLIQPSDATYLAGDDITLVAEVSDSDGKITKASFWVDGRQMNEQSLSVEQGYVTYTWPSVSAGVYQVQARVQDDQGGIATSLVASYEVGEGGDPSSSPEAPETPTPPTTEVSEPGLYYSYYVGEWSTLPNFDQLTPASQGILPNFTFDPAIGKFYTMGFVYEGYLLIEQAGEYTFHVNANDGSNFYLDGKEIINNDGRRDEAQEKSGKVQLTAGYHPIRLTFFERWGPQVLEVRYQGPGVALQLIPDNKLFLNAPEDEIGTSAPIITPNILPAVSVGDDIAVTLPQTEVSLQANASDEDGTIVSYQWSAVSTNSATIASSTSAQTTVTDLKEGMYYFAVVVEDDDESIATDTVKVTVKPAPNVAPLVNAGDDIAVTLPQTEVSLQANASDEDGTIVSYQWSAVSTNSATIVNVASAQTLVTDLKEGTHRFMVTVTDNHSATSNDTVEVTVKAAPIVENKEPRLNYAYYEGQWNTLPDFSQLSAVEEGTVSNFNLSERKQDELFGFTFTGYINIQTTGTYQFYTSSDDGSALYIDGRKIVDNDGLHAKRERSGSVRLTEGKHPIRVDFFEHQGREVLEVKYAGPGISKTLIPNELLSLEGDPVSESPEPPVAKAGEPGLYYSYYVGEWLALPNFDQLTPASQGILPNFTFDPAIGKLYTMGFVYEGYLLIEQAGEYTFHVNANDGSNFYLDGKEIINNDGRKAEAQEKSGKVQLTAGYHPIRLTFFERWGPQVLEVSYQGPGVALQLIPDNKLFLNAPEVEPVKKVEEIYVNFHREGRDVADNWNNMHRSTDPLLLENIDGTSSAITLALATSWDGANHKGFTAGNDNGKYPDAVTRSYFWTQGQEVITLNGVSPDKFYSFTFFASSMFGGNRNTIYRIGNQEVTLNASYNEEKTVTIDNVRPTTDGKIQIEISRAVGSTYGFIGALVIKSTAAGVPVARQESTPKKQASLAPNIEETQLLFDQATISIYPNPSIGIIHIKTAQSGAYWISDIQGNIFKEGALVEQESQSLNLTNLPKGVYLVRTQTSNQWNTQKIIIQ